MTDDPARPKPTARGGGSAVSPRSGTAVQDGDEPRPDDTVESGSGDSAKTASLPVVGGPGDPYLDRNSRVNRGSAGAPAVGPRPTTAPSPPEDSRAMGGFAAAATPAPALASSLPPPSMPPISAAPPQPPSARPAAPSAVDQYAALGLSADAATPGAGAVTATSPAAAPSAPAPPPAPTSTARRPRSQRSPRRARLQIRHFNVWTVFKFSVVLAVALFFVWLIIVAVLYGTLDHLQTIDKINSTVRTIENDSSTNDAVTPRIVFTAAFLIGLVNIVLFIALTTIGSVVYNLCADLVGGIEVTLAERD